MSDDHKKEVYQKLVREHTAINRHMDQEHRKHEQQVRLTFYSSRLHFPCCLHNTYNCRHTPVEAKFTLALINPYNYIYSFKHVLALTVRVSTTDIRI